MPFYLQGNGLCLERMKVNCESKNIYPINEQLNLRLIIVQRSTLMYKTPLFSTKKGTFLVIIRR